jgi:hypothetical protein
MFYGPAALRVSQIDISAQAEVPSARRTDTPVQLALSM